MRQIPVRRSSLVLSLATALAVAGCDTISSDFGALAEGLFPPSGLEAAVMAADRDPDIRRKGTLLLANTDFGGEPEYLRLYRLYAEDDPNPLVKAVAIRALAKHGDPEDAALIARHLRHENRQVRWEAARGLQRLHDSRIIVDLLDSLRNEDEDGDVRVAVATALGQYGDDRVFQGLVAALDAPELAVNQAARGALGQLTGVDYGLDPAAWLDWYDERAGTAGVFADADAYRYPTYTRELGFFERLAFWNPPYREVPGPPAGLERAQTRGTYDESDAEGAPAPDGDAASDAASR